jgi:dipeptidyl aminopeptidase/acylaminoacyl peptidase
VWVYFAHTADGPPTIWRRRADLSAPAELVYDAEAATFPWAISNDGAWLLLRQNSVATSGDIWRLGLEDGGVAELLVSTPANELFPTFSPDGRYLAYQSNETGRPEVYVNSIETGQRWLISTEGGFNPRWAPDGDQVIYVWNQLGYAVTIETDPELTYGDPVAFEWPGASGTYEVSASGDRTLQLIDAAAGPSEEPAERRILVVLNWFEELLARAPIDP